MLFEKPHSQEAEQSVLSGIIVDGLKTEEVVSTFENLLPNHFYEPVHQDIFNAITEMNNRRMVPDLTMLSSHIPQHKEYLIELVKNSAGPANIKYWSQSVREKFVERSNIEICMNAINSLNSKESHEEKMNMVNALLKSIDSSSSRHEVVHLEEFVGEMVEDVDQLFNGQKVAGLPTGFTVLDQYIGGMVNGELVTVGARPSIGKSAIGMNIAENIAKIGLHSPLEKNPEDRGGIPILYITMEMPGKTLAGRVTCSQGSVNNSILKTPKRVESCEWSKFSQGAASASTLPIYVSDLSRPTVHDVKAVARDFKRNNKLGLGLVVIDHLHQMKHNMRNGEVAGIAETTAELKALALELDVPILLMSQLNRGSIKENRWPDISDLRGSGSIEQDSDIVLILHRDDEDEEIKGKGVVMVKKNRAGEKDVSVYLENKLQHYKFTNFAPFEQELY